MREFNTREKNIIEKICDIDCDNIDLFSNHLQNIYFQKDKNQALFIYPQEKKALLYIKKEIYDDLDSRKKEYCLFLEMISLIDYLKVQGFITVFPEQNINASRLHVIKESFEPTNDTVTNSIKLNDELRSDNWNYIIDNNGDIRYEKIELKSELYNWIAGNLIGIVIVSEELKDLVAHQFISKDDRKYKKNKKITWIGIITAWIIGLASLILPFIKKETTAKINEQQYNYILQKSEEGIQINNKILKNIKHSSSDTVKVKNKKK